MKKMLEIIVLFNNYFYWLEIGYYSVNSLGTLEIIDRYIPKNNSIYIDSPIKFIRVLLNKII